MCAGPTPGTHSFAAAGAGLAVWQGAAAAGTGTTLAAIWSDRNECATDPHTTPIGTARLERMGKRVGVVVILRNAVPNQDYDIELWHVPVNHVSCSKDYELGTIHTDANGRGRGQWVSGPEPNHLLFVDVYGSGILIGTDNETDLYNI